MPRKKASPSHPPDPSVPQANISPSGNSLLAPKSSQYMAKIIEWRADKILPSGGPMSQELERLTLRRHHRGSAAAHNFLNGLVKKGINSQEVLDVLRGARAPHVDVFDLHCKWALAAKTYYGNQTRRQALTSLNREYRKIRNTEEPILKSPLVSKLLKDALKREFETIRSILLSLNSCLSDDDFRPSYPFTVGLFDPRQRRKLSEAAEWSRQGFWTPIILELRSIWHKAGMTDYRAFKNIAQLLAVFFPPFLDDPTLVKRRYYHSRQ